MITNAEQQEAMTAHTIHTLTMRCEALEARCERLEKKAELALSTVEELTGAMLKLTRSVENIVSVMQVQPPELTPAA